MSDAKLRAELAGAEATLEALRDALRTLAAHAGGEVRPCKLCGDEVAIVRARGAVLVLTVATGEAHEEECPGLEREEDLEPLGDVLKRA